MGNIVNGKVLIFDTNYINSILNDKAKYYPKLTGLKIDNTFSISVITFVEIVQQRIKNQKAFNELMDLLINFEFNIADFVNYRIIREEFKFYFEKFKKMDKRERKSYFNQIKENKDNLECDFIVVILEWVLYALNILIKENLKQDIEYKKYLENQATKFFKRLKKLFGITKCKKIKDEFNSIVYEELKKIRVKDNNINRELINDIIKEYDCKKTEITGIFKASKGQGIIQNDFIIMYYNVEIEPFLKRFNNKKFSKYIKIVFEKIVARGGKLQANDIADLLIIATVDYSDNILISNDEKINDFLKEEKIYYKIM